MTEPAWMTADVDDLTTDQVKNALPEMKAHIDQVLASLPPWAKDTELAFEVVFDPDGRAPISGPRAPDRNTADLFFDLHVLSRKLDGAPGMVQLFNRTHHQYLRAERIG